MKKHTIVTDPNQIVDGESYIDVSVDEGVLIIFRVIRIYGGPFIKKLSSGYNLGLCCHYGYKETFHSFNILSLEDCNVSPNNYNDCSLWRYDADTLNYLNSLIKNKEGMQEYLSILQQYKRGETYNSVKSKGITPLKPYFTSLHSYYD